MAGFFALTNSADTGSVLTGFTVVLVMVAVAGTPTTGAKAFVFKANQKVWPPELSGPSHWINSDVKAVPSLKTPSAAPLYW